MLHPSGAAVVTNTQDYAHHLKGLSPIGVAAARFAIEKPGLSMPQKDRVAVRYGAGIALLSN